MTKTFIKISNKDIYDLIKKVDKRTINIEKHAIEQNGRVEALGKSNGLLWKFMIMVIATLIGGGGYAVLR